MSRELPPSVQESPRGGNVQQCKGIGMLSTKGIPLAYGYDTPFIPCAHRFGTDGAGPRRGTAPSGRIDSNGRARGASTSARQGPWSVR